MERQLNYSKQRELIINYITNAKTHPTAEDIYVNIKSQLKTISLATVYRNLKVLEELNIVKKISSISDSDRYDSNCFEHGHFVCEKCHSIEDLEMINFQGIKTSLMDKCNIDSISNINLTVNGLCNQCKNRKGD